MNSNPMRTEHFTVGDRVRVKGSGWTGTVVRDDCRRSHLVVAWDSETRNANRFAPETSRVGPLNLEHA